jgi:NAD(P)-dependent dehydrogenase (short-subunit alcohol dehydrogenase family)
MLGSEGAGGPRRPTIVITGATSGVGLATARVLARQSVEVVIVGRPAGDPEGVSRSLREETHNPSVSWAVADLSRMEEVRRLATELLGRFPRLHGLLNNAGGIFFKRQETPEGIERTWALNVLSPFLLTNLLFPALRAAAPSRVVNVASEAHRMGRLRWNDLEGRARYSGWSAYNQSKLALILLTQELARRWDGTGVTVNAVHPGFVRSRFGHNNNGLSAGLLRFAERVFAIPPERAALAVAPLLTASEWEGVSGCYFVHGQVASPSRRAGDRAAAGRIFEALCRQVGLPAATPGQPFPLLGETSRIP